MALGFGLDETADEVFKQLDAFKNCVAEAGLAMPSLANLSEDDTTDTLKQYGRIISMSLDWGHALTDRKMGRTIKLIYASLDDLAAVFNNEKAFSALKNYKHPGDGIAYAAILIEESKKLAETVNKKLKALQPGYWGSGPKDIVNWALPKDITVDLLIEKTQTLVDIIDEQEKRLKQVSAAPVIPEVSIETEASMTLEAQLKKAEEKIEQFEFKIEERSFNTLEEINSELENQAALMSNLIRGFDKLDEDSKKEIEEDVEKTQHEHAVVLASLNRAKRELTELHEKEEQLESALSIKVGLPTSTAAIASGIGKIEQNIGDMTVAQKKLKKKEKSDLFSRAYQAFSGNVSALNNAIDKFFKKMNDIEGKLDKMPDHVREELKREVDEQRKRVTEEFKLSEGHEVTEKEALSLVPPASRATFNQALTTKEGGASSLAKLWRNAENSGRKAMSSTYSEKFKRYKEQLADMQAVSQSIAPEAPAESSKEPKDDSQLQKKGL